MEIRIQTTIVIPANYLFIYLYDQLHFNYNFGFFINIIIPFLSFLFCHGILLCNQGRLDTHYIAQDGLLSQPSQHDSH